MRCTIVPCMKNYILEVYMRELRFSVQMRIKDMYRFLLHHGYSGISGVINLLITVGAIALLILGVGDTTTAKVMLVIVALLFSVINPVYLYYKAAKQVKLTPMFAKPLDYLINEEGITVSQGEEQLLIEWKDLRRAVETNKDFYIYLSLTRAYIFPKTAVKEEMASQLRCMIEQNTAAKVCKCSWKRGTK